MKRSPFRAVLLAQARYMAPLLALATVATGLLPLLTLQASADDPSHYGRRIEVLLTNASFFSRFYPGVAVILGTLFAAANWLPDASGGWVYAFTLPISRARLALLRLVSGALLLVPPMLSLCIVGVVGAKVAALPPILQTHAGALATRFAAATLVVYAFASIMALLGRRLWYLAAGVIVLFIFDGFGLGLFGHLIDILFLYPLSPLHALAGYWLFLDV